MSLKNTTVRPILWFLRLIAAIVAFFLILFLAFPIGFYGMAMYIEPKLPKMSELKAMPLEMPLQIYTADQKLIGQYGNTFSMPISYEQLPKKLEQAFLAAEDDSFFEHSGISVKGLGRAITQMVSDSDQQTGGSTITQQVAKNYFLSPEQTFERKLTEMYLARKIEQELSKNEILTLYVNKIYLGQGAYGIKAGARRYYNKELHQLTIAEMAMLAGLPKAPSEFNPVVNPERALTRRNWILKRMFEQGHIKEHEYQEAIASEIGLNMYHRPSYDLVMPDLAEVARTALVKQYGDKVMNSGWKVELTVDSLHQLNAEQAVATLPSVRGDRQLNSPTLEAKSGSLKQFPIVPDVLTGYNTYPAQITSIDEKAGRIGAILPDGREIKINHPVTTVYLNTKRTKTKRVKWQVETGNIIRVIPTGAGEKAWTVLYPHIQGALASLNPQNGAVIALVSGINTKHTNFNRAVQGYRQPGSTIKPLVYSGLMEYKKRGGGKIEITPYSAISGAPDKRGWPKGGAGGPASLLESMARSRNTSAVNALKELGLNTGINLMVNMGLDKSRMSPSFALALGAGEATPLQMATAYATFINGGHRIQPYMIERIYNFDNDIIYQANPVQACATCFNSKLEKTNKKLLEDFEKAQKEANEIAKKLAEEKLAKEKLTQEQAKDPKHTLAQTEETAEAVAEDEPTEDTQINQIFRLKPKAAPQYSTATQAPSLLSKKVANYTVQMLKASMSVTGKNAIIGGRSDIGGKTGTTNKARDVWFAGVHPTNVAVVWVGFDTPKEMGDSTFGGTLAAPVWRKYMASYLSGKPLEEAEGEQSNDNATSDTPTKKTKNKKDKKAKQDTNKVKQTETPPARKKPKAEPAPAVEVSAEGVNEGMD